MRTRLLALIGSAGLVLTLLTALPAIAAYDVTISFPLDQNEFYSPFDGPATLSFAFDPADPPALFHVKVRPLGETAIVKKDYVIDPDTALTNPVEKSLSWGALSTSSDRTYEVVVSVEGGGAGPWTNFFVLHPSLVRITNIAPDPFFPWIDDTYKDTTTVSFALAADATTEARVFQAKAKGKCCASRVLTLALGSQSLGDRTWEWDGRDDAGDNLPKGDYYVKIWAYDGTFPPVLSKPVKVTIARTYRATATKSKLGKAYHHVGPSSSIVLGGGCLTYLTGDGVSILCQGGKISVYWRWRLADDERIVGQHFQLTSLKQDCPRSIRSTGHTRRESRFTETENIDNFRGLCTVSLAKITYSYPVAS